MHIPPIARSAFPIAVLFALLGCGHEGQRGNDRASSHAVSTPAPSRGRSAAAQLDARFAYESPDGSSTPASAFTSVLVITLDTCRRDHLTCYGDANGTTPNLELFAKESIVFDEAYSTAPVTLPAHASIFTGFDPSANGVRNNGTHPLDPGFVTLAERIHALGYQTGAVVAGFPVDHRYGLAQGFDTYDDSLSAVTQASPVPERNAEEVTSRGLRWIRTHKDAGPWFAWLHYFDAHDPYLPPAPFQALFSNPYDGELAYLDAHLGGLFRELKRQGLWDQTLIVLTADHGESLGDHGEETHSLFLYQGTTAVPLLIKPPRSTGFAVRRIAELVSTVDLCPTVLELAGGSFDPKASEGGTVMAASIAALSPIHQGRSLVPLMRDGLPARKHAYFETLVPELDYGWSPFRGLVMDGRKLILGAKPELYDLREDPTEARDIAASNEALVAAMTDTLHLLMANERESSVTQMDAEMIENLRSLGYAGGGGTHSSGALPDARDMLWALDAFDHVRESVVRRQMDQASAQLAQVLQRDPGNKFARRMQSWALIETGYPKQAEELIDRILADEPKAGDRAVLETRLARALFRQGKLDRADAILQGVLKQTPDSADALLILIKVAGARNQLDRAKDAARRAEALDPQDYTAAIYLGRVYTDREKYDDALRTYQTAIDRFGQVADLLAGISGVKIRQGKIDEAGPIVQRILAADATHPRANHQMGLLQIAVGHQPAAAQFFARAVTGEPGNARFQASLGDLLVKLKNYTEAVTHLDRAIELGSDTAVTRSALGFAQAELGDHQAARTNLTKALALKPDAELRSRIKLELDGL